MKELLEQRMTELNLDDDTKQFYRDTLAKESKHPAFELISKDKQKYIARLLIAEGGRDGINRND